MKFVLGVVIGFAMLFGTCREGLAADNFFARTIPKNESILLTELLGQAAQGTFSIKSKSHTSISVTLKSSFINRVPKIGPFPSQPDGNFYLPEGSKGNFNGSMFSGYIPREIIRGPGGKRLIPLLQTPDGNRLYLVDKILVPSDPYPVMIEVRSER